MRASDHASDGRSIQHDKISHCGSFGIHAEAVATLRENAPQLIDENFFLLRSIANTGK